MERGVFVVSAELTRMACVVLVWLVETSIPFVFFVCLFVWFFLNLSGMQEVKNAFNEYTIYYHATTTRGHPGTCAPLKYTEETSKIQQLQAGIHG